MASTLTKRPVPALAALLALLLLTALVWWRVMHRDGAADTTAPCPTPTQPTATLPAPATITVKVLNSTDRSGIAAKARTALVDDGFKVPDPAANDSPKAKVQGPAEIRYGPPGAKAASVLRYYFPGAKLVTTTSKTAVVVVSLGDTYRSVATRTAVQAALTRDHVALASSGPAQPSGASPTC